MNIEPDDTWGKALEKVCQEATCQQARKIEMRYGAFSFHISPYWIIVGLGRLSAHWHFPWGWNYGWKSFLLAYEPDSESWCIRIVGLEINWMLEP